MPRKRREVSPGQVRDILERYDKGAGMLVLAHLHDFNVVVIRRVLIENGRMIRKVGRPFKK